MTLFGRDALWTSLMALPVDPTLALGVLEALAELQGADVNSRTEEEPGRILDEVDDQPGDDECDERQPDRRHQILRDVPPGSNRFYVGLGDHVSRPWKSRGEGVCPPPKRRGLLLA